MNYDDFEKELLEHEDEILANARTPTGHEKDRFREAARDTLNKDKRINIRISSRDLGSLQRRANRYGMPYQTLITSILHRYISGEIKEVGIEQNISGNSESLRDSSSSN
jgi:predicted DNA binding CopG/RHH family protein